MSNKEKPYIIETKVVHEYKYNPKFGDDRMCRCGHPYYRHFDTYEHMEAVGCKYCYDCRVFVEEGTEPQNSEAGQRPCTTCGQLRPVPTEPDEIWEFISPIELKVYGERAKWTQVRTVREYEYDEPILCIVPTNPEEYFCEYFEEEGELPKDLRIWWPSDVMWRKV